MRSGSHRPDRAPVDHHLGPDDPRRAVGDQEADEVGDLFRLGETPEGHAAERVHLSVRTAHLIYVSGDVGSQVIRIPSAQVDVHVHAVSLAGGIDDLEAEMARLAKVIAPRE